MEKGGGEAGYRYLDLTFALSHGEFNIDRYHDNTQDKSFFEGHYYAAVPPGLSIAGLFPLYASRAFYGLLPHRVTSRLEASLNPKIIDFYLSEDRFDSDGPFLSSINPLPFFFSSFAITFFLGPFLGSLLLLLLMRFVDVFYNRSFHRKKLLLTLVLLGFFGSMLFVYSLMLNSHLAPAFFFLLSFYLLWRHYSLKKGKALLFWAGLFAGLMVFFNYSIFFLVLPLVLYIIMKARKDVVSLMKEDFLLFGAGFLVFALLLLLYNFLLFGSPLLFPHNFPYGEIAQAHEQGMFGFTMPKLVPFISLLFSPFRGLFFFSPVLLFASAGLYSWFRKRKHLAEATFIASSLLLALIVFSSYSKWHGDWAFGPRHLLPIVPVLVMALPEGVTLVSSLIGRWLLVVLGAFSVLFSWLGVQYGILSPIIKFPLGHYLRALLTEGPASRAVGYAGLLFGLSERALLPINLLLLVALLAVIFILVRKLFEQIEVVNT